MKSRNKETTGPPNVIMYQGIHHQPCQAPLVILEHISSHKKAGSLNFLYETILGTKRKSLKSPGNRIYPIILTSKCVAGKITKHITCCTFCFRKESWLRKLICRFESYSVFNIFC